jgi:hypothetical protein
MHLFSNGHRHFFGPYFVIPFALAVGLLLVEMAVVTRRRSLHGVALSVPIGLVILATIGHRQEGIYLWFYNTVASRLGGDPLYLTLLLSAGYYLYAALRRVEHALEALTLVLVSLAVVGPDTLTTGHLVAPRALPMLAAAALQLALGFRRSNSWRCLLGFAGLVLVAALLLPDVTGDGLLRKEVLFHLALLAVLIVGAVFEDMTGRALRLVAGILVVLACLAAMFDPLGLTANLPPWLVLAYPPAMAILLGVYGWLLKHRPSQVLALLALAGWLVQVGWNGYLGLRAVVPGLDHILLSLVLFALAVLVSLAKSGHLSMWLAARRRSIPTLDRLSANGVYRRGHNPPHGG